VCDDEKTPQISSSSQSQTPQINHMAEQIREMNNNERKLWILRAEQLENMLCSKVQHIFLA